MYGNIIFDAEIVHLFGKYEGGAIVAAIAMTYAAVAKVAFTAAAFDGCDAGCLRVISSRHRLDLTSNTCLALHLFTKLTVTTAEITTVSTINHGDCRKAILSWHA